MTGSAAGLDSDATTHAAKPISTGHTGTLADLNTAITDMNLSPTTWDADLSGIYDWSVSGDSSQDPTSGFIAYEAAGGDLAAATLSVGAGVITFDLTAQAAADRIVYLVKRLDSLGFVQMRQAMSIAIRAEYDLSVLDVGAADTELAFIIGNEDFANTATTERVAISIIAAGGNRVPRIKTEKNDAVTTVTGGAFAAYLSPSMLWCGESASDMAGGVYESVTDTITDCTRIQENTTHVQAGGANAPYLIVAIKAKQNAKRIAGTISSIRATMI
tara:strand:- start:1060 stop:1878 length:819 start_codon:yes stop_codon:yes gene_type:complete